MSAPIRVIIVMGVSGAGKSTFGSALAAALGWRFEDADLYHSPAHVAKMAAGVALTDTDRADWLRNLRQLVRRALEDQAGLVLACSALRESYRNTLGALSPGVALVYLTAPSDILTLRLTARADHFMPPTLLESQLTALEPPQAALELDTTASVTDLVRKTRANLRL